jgi:PKD repeat protein
MNQIQFRIYDVVGHSSISNINTVLIDTQCPITSEILNGTLGLHGWYLSNVLLNLSVIESTSGIQNTYYQIDNSSYATFGGMGILIFDGLHTIQYYSVDIAGNIEIYSTFQIRIDKTPPIYTNSTSVLLNINADDILSGIWEMCFSDDGLTWSDWEMYQNYRIYQISEGDGEKTVYMKVRDYAGNEFGPISDSIILDGPPFTTINIVSGIIGLNEWYISPIELELIAYDNTSNIQQTWYRINNGTWMTYNIHLFIYESGTHTFDYYSIDDAGNSESLQTILLKIDNIAPVANAGEDQSVSERSQLVFNATGSLDNIGIVNYTWTFTDDIIINIWGIGPNHQFINPGVFTVTLNVTDAAGNWHTDIIIVTVNDTTPPIADAGLDKFVNEGTLMVFNGSASTDNIGIVDYSWTFMDKTLVTLWGIAPSYTFMVPGIFTVTLTVKDAAGNTDSDSLVITVLPDTDGDGTPDEIDDDDDNDGTPDVDDDFPTNSEEDTDTDDDGVGDNEDMDDDGDGVQDTEDDFPLDSTETVDTDGDGIGNNADTDDDGDGYLDAWEEFLGTDSLNNSDFPIDSDNDGVPNGDIDNSQSWMDTDDDGDGIPDIEDNPTNSTNASEEGFGNYWWLIIIIIIAVLCAIYLIFKKKVKEEHR